MAWGWLIGRRKKSRRSNTGDKKSANSVRRQRRAAGATREIFERSSHEAGSPAASVCAGMVSCSCRIELPQFAAFALSAECRELHNEQRWRRSSVRRWRAQRAARFDARSLWNRLRQNRRKPPLCRKMPPGTAACDSAAWQKACLPRQTHATFRPPGAAGSRRRAARRW